MSTHAEIVSSVMKGWKFVVLKDQSLHSMAWILMVQSQKEVTPASLLSMKGGYH